MSLNLQTYADAAKIDRQLALRRAEREAPLFQALAECRLVDRDAANATMSWEEKARGVSKLRRAAMLLAGLAMRTKVCSPVPRREVRAG